MKNIQVFLFIEDQGLVTRICVLGLGVEAQFEWHQFFSTFVHSVHLLYCYGLVHEKSTMKNHLKIVQIVQIVQIEIVQIENSTMKISTN